MRSTGRRRVIAASIALVVCAIGADTAQAGTLSIAQRMVFVDGGGISYHDLYYQAFTGENNDLTVRQSPDHQSLVFRERSASIAVDPAARLRNPGTSDPGAQWGCLAVKQSNALCAYVAPAPSTCDLVGGCFDEYGAPAGFAQVFIGLRGGDDRLDSADGQREIISCGLGNDSVVADASDSLGADCEHVSLL